MWPVIGAIAGALINNVFQKDARQEQAQQSSEVNAANAAATAEANAQNIALSRELQGRNEALYRDTTASNEALQREFAQMGIRWKVEDAEAAGLHPLYALGGSGPAYSPAPALVHGSAPEVRPQLRQTADSGSYLGGMGQEIGSALARTLDPAQAAERALQLKLLEAQADKESAQAQYYRSQSVGGPGGGQPAYIPANSGYGQDPIHLIDAPYLKDTIRAQPSDIESSRTSDSSSTPGERPAFSDYSAFGTTLRLPSKGATEALESIEPLGAIATAAENIRYHRLLDGAFRFLDAQSAGLKNFAANFGKKYRGPNYRVEHGVPPALHDWAPNRWNKRR